MVESGTTQIVYAPSGQKFALMNGQTVTKAFVPLPAGAQAVYSGSTLAYFRHPDWLGSSRLTTTTSRTLYSSLAYAPFGETYAESGTPDRSFTGQNQDTIQGGTAGLYDFLYREYALYGRWISPDPAGLGAANPTTPQSLNRYAYVMNAPTTLVDPKGLNASSCSAEFQSCGGGTTWDGDLVAMNYGGGGGGGGGGSTAIMEGLERYNSIRTTGCEPGGEICYGSVVVSFQNGSVTITNLANDQLDEAERVAKQTYITVSPKFVPAGKPIDLQLRAEVDLSQYKVTRFSAGGASVSDPAVFTSGTYFNVGAPSNRGQFGYDPTTVFLRVQGNTSVTLELSDINLTFRHEIPAGAPASFHISHNLSWYEATYPIYVGVR
ncbi:MAG: RHS repeat-associated core domain-containing protein [Acidobacteriia bacterium]|nr:RHS repeat-associated core domain-containing protein [Terriglobia bacterium]